MGYGNTKDVQVAGVGTKKTGYMIRFEDISQLKQPGTIQHCWRNWGVRPS
jgi:hypothetical protein